VHPSFAGLNHIHRHVAGWLARHGLDRLLAAEGAAGLDLRRLRKTVELPSAHADERSEITCLDPFGEVQPERHTGVAPCCELR
jgi:hypothetical protein